MPRTVVLLPTVKVHRCKGYGETFIPVQPSERRREHLVLPGAGLEAEGSFAGMARGLVPHLVEASRAKSIGTALEQSSTSPTCRPRPLLEPPTAVRVYPNAASSLSPGHQCGAQ